MDVPQEVIDQIDSRVVDGKVYVAVNSLFEVNASLALTVLCSGPVIEQVMMPGSAFTLDCYRSVLMALQDHYAADLVPDSPEALDR